MERILKMLGRVSQKKQKWHTRNVLTLLSLGTLTFLGNPLQGNQIPAQKISTELGTYLIQITPPTLPELETIPLFRKSSPKFPKLPKWKERAKPTGFSVFSSAEDLYHEGLGLFNKRELRNSLELFDELIEDFPQSQFYLGAMHWKAQILIRLKEYAKAQKILSQVIATNKPSEYRRQSAHTQIWLTLRLRKTAEALQAIEQYTRTIFPPAFLEGILPLKIYANLQQKQYAEALEALLQLQQQFPDNAKYFENAVKIAELYYQLEQWTPITPLIERVRENYQGHPQMEHLLYIGISADLKSKSWEKAQQKLEWIEQKGIEKPTVFAQSSFYLNLWQSQLERARFDVERFESRSLKSKNLRQLFHYAFHHQRFRFLVSSDYDETLLADWDEEGFWVLAQAYEQLGESENAYQEYQKALSLTEKPELQETFSFNLAAIELKLNNFDKAGSRLQKMLLDYRQSPKKSEYAFWYAVTQGQLGSGLVPLTLKQVKPPSDRMDDSLFYLQRYYHAKQKWEQSRQIFLKLVFEYPQTHFLLWAYYYQADSLFSQKQFRAANRVLEDWRKNHQDEVLPEEMIQLWANVLIELKNYNATLQILEQTEKESQNFALVQLRLKVLKALNEHEAIINFVTDRIKIPWNAEQIAFLHFIRAESAYTLQQFQPAIEYYREALQSNVQGDPRYLYHQLAKLLHATKNYLEFIRISQKVWEGPKDQLSSNVLILLSDYFLQLPDKAQEQRYLKLLAQNYENDLKQKPSSKDKAALLFKLAKVKKRLGLYQEADQLFDQTIALEDTTVPIEVLEEKGDTALLSKQYKKAAAAFLKVVYLNSQHEPAEKFDLLKKIAYSYEQIGQVREARAIFRKILREFKSEKIQKQAQENLKRLENVSRETQG